MLEFTSIPEVVKFLRKVARETGNSNEAKNFRYHLAAEIGAREILCLGPTAYSITNTCLDYAQVLCVQNAFSIPSATSILHFRLWLQVQVQTTQLQPIALTRIRNGDASGVIRLRGMLQIGIQGQVVLQHCAACATRVSTLRAYLFRKIKLLSQRNERALAEILDMVQGCLSLQHRHPERDNKQV